MRKDRKAYIGVDIGTSSIAAVVVDYRGDILETRTVPNPSAGEPTKDGRHEQNADAILKAVNGLVGACETLIRARKLKFVEIGWTGQMHGLVAVDRKFRGGGARVPGTCGRVRVVGFGGFVMVDPSVRRLHVRLQSG